MPGWSGSGCEIIIKRLFHIANQMAEKSALLVLAVIFRMTALLQSNLSVHKGESSACPSHKFGRVDSIGIIRIVGCTVLFDILGAIASTLKNAVGETLTEAIMPIVSQHPELNPYD